MNLQKIRSVLLLIGLILSVLSKDGFAEESELEGKRSRFEIFSQLGPGFFTRENTVSKAWQVSSALLFHVGFSFYAWDQCQGNSQGTCVQLLVDGTFTSQFVVRDPNTAIGIGLLAGIEMQLYIGSQRMVALLLNGRLGYGYALNIDQPDYIGGIWGLIGAGVFLRIPKTGIGISLKVTYLPDVKNYHTVCFPVGIHYRF